MILDSKYSCNNYTMSFYNKQFAYLEPISNDTSTLFSLLPAELRLELAVYYRNTNYTVTITKEPLYRDIFPVMSTVTALDKAYFLNVSYTEQYSIPVSDQLHRFAPLFTKNIRMFGKWYSRPLGILVSENYRLVSIVSTKGEMIIRLIREYQTEKIGIYKKTVVSSITIPITENLLNILTKCPN